MVDGLLENPKMPHRETEMTMEVGCPCSSGSSRPNGSFSIKSARTAGTSSCRVLSGCRWRLDRDLGGTIRASCSLNDRMHDYTIPVMGIQPSVYSVLDFCHVRSIFQ